MKRLSEGRMMLSENLQGKGLHSGDGAGSPGARPARRK